MILIKLITSKHGYDDYDVYGHPTICRICPYPSIHKGEFFNAYGRDAKRGIPWQGSIPASLAKALNIRVDEIRFL